MAETFMQGTILAYSADGAAYTDIAEVESIDAAKSKRKKIDKTTLASGLTKLSRAGMIEVDGIKVKMMYVKTIYATLLGFHELASPNKYWRITYPDASTQIFQGFIAEIDRSFKADGDDIGHFEFTIEPIAAIAFTAGA